MRDWEQFVEHTPWFLEPGDVPVVGSEVVWSRGGIKSLPHLSALLQAATLTAVSISGKAYELLAWGPADQRRGWLCDPPPESEPIDVHETHRLFWSVCGGIVERFREPSCWWMNQNDILTARAGRLPVSAVLGDYRWIWDDAGLDVPIEPDDYYPVAIEANGNLTLAHRHSGELLLFAQDHAFSRVTPLPGCPPYSLMTIDDLPDLASWIEECAAVWT